MDPSTDMSVIAAFAVSTSANPVMCSTLSRQDCFYEGQFVISGILGEEPITITVSGSGSFDEKHRDLIDLVIDPNTVA